MSESHSTLVAHQFETAAQQREAATLGMWAFLATEVLFFGTLFLGYAVYRHAYPEAFLTGSLSLNHVFGTVNTGVLLCSSFAMALAVHAAASGHKRGIINYLILTIVLATVFLGFKAYEYHHEWVEGLVPALNWNPKPELVEGIEPMRLKLFFVFYFTMTGIHATHMVVGIGLMVWLIIKARRDAFSPDYYNPVEMVGLYWHFVDIVWVFLFPMIYLLRH